MSPFDARNTNQGQETKEETFAIHTEAKSKGVPTKGEMLLRITQLSPSTRKRTNSDDNDEKMEARRAANRKSAFESRKRRKILLADLQRAVNDLKNEKEAHFKENIAIRLQLQACLAENRQLRFSLVQQQQLGHAASGVAAITSLQGMPPHAIVAPPPLLPILLSSHHQVKVQAPSFVPQASVVPQGQNQGGLLSGRAENLNMDSTAAIAQLLVNHRAAAGTPSNTSDIGNSFLSS